MQGENHFTTTGIASIPIEEIILLLQQALETPMYY